MYMHSLSLSIYLSLSLHNEYYYYCTIFENMRKKNTSSRYDEKLVIMKYIDVVLFCTINLI